MKVKLSVIASIVLLSGLTPAQAETVSITDSGVVAGTSIDNLGLFGAPGEAYPVDSGSPTCSVLIGGNRAATRTLFDGRRSFACPIPEGLS